MLQPPLQLLGPSQTPPSPPFIDLESQLPETQAQTSLTLNQEISQIPETQPLHLTAINSEILLQLAQIQASQPHSAMETELLHLQPPTQQTPSLDINTQQINMLRINGSYGLPNVWTKRSVVDNLKPYNRKAKLKLLQEPQLGVHNV
ncbi:hypothetical protein NC653_010837 [Populus alba x Populus x berolinensis]|uniref:Uncharacterized protein n=1 Tax=Populus alba x Populus x berolinensis TaxID=444605 RepID=A0AAD6R0S4_9ROSI|nr:hypothetical protein NC653_010837 [Populus alba x Populus x berolinensis]